jgi:hypothetical protein
MRNKPSSMPWPNSIGYLPTSMRSWRWPMAMLLNHEGAVGSPASRP